MRVRKFSVLLFTEFLIALALSGSWIAMSFLILGFKNLAIFFSSDGSNVISCFVSISRSVAPAHCIEDAILRSNAWVKPNEDN